MAKNNVEPSGNGGGLFSSVKGVIVAALIGWIAISSSYGAGRTVSDKVLKATNKERKKGEKALKREQKERQKEREHQRKLQRIKARKGR